MTEKPRQGKEINFNRKTIADILDLLINKDWQINPDAFNDLNINNKVVHGDSHGATFWHGSFPPHTDVIFYANNNMIKRNCLLLKEPRIIASRE